MAKYKADNVLMMLEEYSSDELNSSDDSLSEIFHDSFGESSFDEDELNNELNNELNHELNHLSSDSANKEIEVIFELNEAFELNQQLLDQILNSEPKPSIF
jgi:hypothetical protein